MSEAIDSRGRVLASAPFGGEEAMLFAELKIGSDATLPFDRIVAPAATFATGIFIAFLFARNAIRRFGAPRDALKS